MNNSSMCVRCWLAHRALSAREAQIQKNLARILAVKGTRLIHEKSTGSGALGYARAASVRRHARSGR
ncbi:MAG: hypothetical protein VW546_05510 [Gammaproteobacteria bacterium]